MKLNQNRAFWTSAILHLIVLAAVFIASLVEFFVPKELPHVFEMVSESVSEDRVESSALAEPLRDLRMPEVKPLEIPDPVVPTIPEPVRRPVEPAVVKPVATPEPPKAEEKLISIEDFRKKVPQKPPKQRVYQSSSPRIKVPTINTEKFGVNLQSSLSTADASASSELTSAERTALQRYGDELNSRLNRAWIKPGNLSGINLVATILFDVSRSGTISNIRFRPGSGNASFDESVKAAFASVRLMGPTPTGQGHTFTMSFKMIN